MIAFALVYEVTEENNVRRRWTPDRIKHEYESLTSKIFKTAGCSLPKRLINKMFRKRIPIVPYTQEVLEKKLKEMFPDMLTDDVIQHSNCLAGAVARKFNQNTSDPDHLQIFDGKSFPIQLIWEVLKGSADAPVYFEIPTKIGCHNHVDGGIGGSILSILRFRKRKKDWHDSSPSGFVRSL